MSDPFATLSTDLTELILSHLPIPSLLRASLSCKLFLSLISSPNFLPPPYPLSPWFFLCGLHNTSSKNNQSFAFDPSSNSWFRLPSPSPSPTSSPQDLSASTGFLFSTTSSSSFSSSSSIFKPLWSHYPPLNFPRLNPLIAVISPSSPSFIVAGGVRFIGCLVDIEESLSVEIYNPKTRSWDLFPPLPNGFPSGFSSQTLSSALFNDKFYVLGIYSFFVSAFDLNTRSWGPVLTLRPPGVIFSFLIACSNALVLAGMCNAPNCGPCFTLWRVDELSMEFSEIAVMPQELLFGLVDIEEDDKFASLKCVGMGNLVYVFNEEYHKRYPACVCEIGFGSGGVNVTSRWRKVPPLPSPVNKFHKVISFCSVVSPRDIFHGGVGGEARIWDAI